MVRKQEEVPEKKPWEQAIDSFLCDRETRLKISGRIH
jgi:hypothetical protein